MLSKLGHDCAELEMELTKITVSLKLSTQLVVRLFVLVDRLIVTLWRRGANAIVFVKVHPQIVAVFSGGNYATTLLCWADFVIGYVNFKKSL